MSWQAEIERRLEDGSLTDVSVFILEHPLIPQPSIRRHFDALKNSSPAGGPASSGPGQLLWGPYPKAHATTSSPAGPGWSGAARPLLGPYPKDHAGVISTGERTLCVCVRAWEPILDGMEVI